MSIDCSDLTRQLRPAFTSIVYANNDINHTIHDKVRQWYNLILNKIYTDQQLKNIIYNILTKKLKIIADPEERGSRDSLDNLKAFIKNTYSIIEISDKIKEKRQKRIIDLLIKFTHNGRNKQDLFNDTTIYDLFFILYLKGGMATRFICMCLNSLSKAEMFTEEIQNEQLGTVSDYDFNCCLNPILERNEYTLIYDKITNLSLTILEEINHRDIFFKDRRVWNELLKNADSLAKTNPIFNNCRLRREIMGGFGLSFNTRIPNKFGLIRLMVKVPINCYYNFCFGEPNSSINIEGELIDISLSMFENIVEKNHHWSFGNKAIHLKWCTIRHNRCELINDINEKYSLSNNLRVYSLNSAIDDLNFTIRDTDERGDNTKSEKRKKRLSFFNNLICQYTLLLKNIEDPETFDLREFSKFCVENIEKLLCENKYIDSDTALILAQFSLGITQDRDIIFSIIIKYIQQIIYSNNNNDNFIYYNSSLLYGPFRDYNDFIHHLTPEQKELLKPFLCSLLIDTISLKKSLNDNFIQYFIGFSFLSVMSTLRMGNIEEFKKNVLNFNSNIILIMESINNIVTRPFIKNNYDRITQHIWNYVKTYSDINDNVQLLIRGGCAVHLNIISNPDIIKTVYHGILSNDIDIVINKFDNNFIINLNNYFDTILVELQRSHPQLDITFKYNLFNNNNMMTYQVIIDYLNVFENSAIIFTNDRQLRINDIIPRIQHHIIEINFVQTAFSLDQVNLIERHGNREYAFYNRDFLIKEYNQLLMESKHWYRKSKYLRRIAALNNIITNYDSRKHYESEFILPC